MKSPFDFLHPKNNVTFGTEIYSPSFCFSIKNYFSCKYPLKGANPVPTEIKMTFFHFIASLNDDFLSSAFIPYGFELKNLEINPFSIILAITITFCCFL